MNNLEIKISNILLFMIFLSLWAIVVILLSAQVDMYNHRNKLEMKQIKKEICDWKIQLNKLPLPELDVPSITSKEFEVENVEVPGIPYGNR